jgi:hypothetical protein
MALSREDLMQAKGRIVDRFLSVSLNSEVMFRTVTLRVADVVRSASRNVHAVGIGQRIAEGKQTGEPCVRIYVVQKLPKSLLPPRDLLPESIDGVPVDVIETPPAFLHAKARRKERPSASTAFTIAEVRRSTISTSAAAPPCTTNRRKAQRPIIAGISVGHRNVTAGTIGYFCNSVAAGDDPANVYILSNNHVLADTNIGEPGDDVFQPGPIDGATDIDAVAVLHRYVDMQLNGTSVNSVDCALAAMRPGTEHRLEICRIGRITGRIPAVENMLVRKHGRTTGYTEGKVTDVNYTALVGMDNLNPSVVGRFENQIRIEAANGFPAIGLGGDSGSLVVDLNSASAVGLYFAGPDSGEYGVANHIADVENELQARLIL